MAATRDQTEKTADAGDYLDTVSLLQDEIARLEAELRLRIEISNLDRHVPDDREIAGSSAEHRIEELSALLAERDDTIGQLWDHIAATEQAEESRAAEWDQIRRWILELEERLADDSSPPRHSEAGRQEAEALRSRWDAQRISWEGHRRRLENEIAALHARLGEASAGGADGPLESLEQENRRLREECLRLASFEAEAAEVAPLRERILSLDAESHQRLLKIERLERVLRGDRPRPDPGPAADPPNVPSAGPSPPGEPGPHERVRALREHLRELHEREEQERLERRKASPLSRLWNRSGAKR